MASTDAKFLRRLKLSLAGSHLHLDPVGTKIPDPALGQAALADGLANHPDGAGWGFASSTACAGLVPKALNRLVTCGNTKTDPSGSAWFGTGRDRRRRAQHLRRCGLGVGPAIARGVVELGLELELEMELELAQAQAQAQALDQEHCYEGVVLSMRRTGPRHCPLHQCYC